MINLTFDDSEDFKNYLSNSDDKDFALDINSLNIFESLRFMVLSSAYFYQKYPEEKLKFKIKSNDIKSLISEFGIKNLEFI